jgi:hypothetical protein
MAQRCRRLLRNPHQATLKRGIFYSVADLRAAINRFLDDHDAESKPFEWTADPDKIIAAVRRGRQMSDSIRWAPHREAFDRTCAAEAETPQVACASRARLHQAWARGRASK